MDTLEHADRWRRVLFMFSVNAITTLHKDLNFLGTIVSMLGRLITYQGNAEVYVSSRPSLRSTDGVSTIDQWSRCLARNEPPQSSHKS